MFSTGTVNSMCPATPMCYLNSIATDASFSNFQILFKVSQLNKNCCMLLLNTLTLHHCQDLGVIVSTNMSWTKTNNVITKNHTESLISFAAAFSYSNQEAPLINFFETHLLQTKPLQIKAKYFSLF